ncbi:MAG: hypothetical protein IPO31_02335 [Candidatus Obscuribacter sp.]|nr:hypothetical protein [Candidatus Obscuribacter sp.]
MSEEPAWLTQYIEKAKTYKRAQSCNSLTLTLHAMLLRAIDLECEKLWRLAANLSNDALKKARQADASDPELQSMMADLCTVSARCLLKLSDTFNGVALFVIALKLYTTLYGINDGRSQNCASSLRSIFRTESNHSSRCWLDYFCRANDTITKLRQLGLLANLKHKQIESHIRAQADSLHIDALSLPRDLGEEQSDMLQDKYLARLIFALYQSSDRDRQSDRVLLLEFDPSIPLAIDQCDRYFHLFSQHIQPEPILVTHKYFKTKDARIWLYYKKGKGLTDTATKPVSEVQTIYKKSIYDLNDIASLFSNRLRKLHCAANFYKLNNPLVPNLYAYFLLGSRMRHAVGNLLKLEQIK